MAQNHKLPQSVTNGWLPMSTREKDVFSFLMYKMSQMEQKDIYEPEEHFFTIDARQMIDLTGVEADKHDYAKACSELTGKKFRLIRSQTQNPMISVLVSNAEFKPDGQIEIEIPQKILPELIDVTRRYTLVDLEIIMGLRSKYAKRLYELLSQFRSSGYASFELHDFRGKMGTLDVKTGKVTEHADWKNFKRLVIKAAVDEINDKHTDFNVTWEPTKRGRKIVGVQFWFNIKNHQTRIQFEKIQVLNPDSEIAELSKLLKRVGAANWQIDFVLKYRRGDIRGFLDTMKEINYDQYMKKPETMGALFAHIAGCKNKEEIEAWKRDRGLI